MGGWHGTSCRITRRLMPWWCWLPAICTIWSICRKITRTGHRPRLAAAKASTLLAQAGFPADKLAAVAHAIEAHSFSANITPQTDEARIVQDADRMDALGAIGLARMFYTSGRMGRQLAHPDKPLGRAEPG
jgi:HD superfamily phosphodiesterase